MNFVGPEEGRISPDNFTLVPNTPLETLPSPWKYLFETLILASDLSKTLHIPLHTPLQNSLHHHSSHS